MNVIKPLDISLLFKVFEWDSTQNFAATAMIGFSLENGESILEPDLWKFVPDELGKDQALDYCMPKHNGEVLVYGQYHAPGGRPVTADRVGVSLGPVSKELAVIGDRYWRPVIGPTPPEPFTTMPIDYAHAFGGAGFDRNPLGKGVAEIKLETGETVTPMPNIEDPGHPVTDKGQRPEPAGFMPLDPTWPQRSSKLGTYDEKWIAERAPAYPEDLDWTHFNTAAPDQWIDAFFSGDEAYEIVNMHPDEPRIKGALPGFRVHCHVNMKTAPGAAPDFREIRMRAETVCFFPHVKKGVLIYRGTTPVVEDDGTDVHDIVVGYEWMNSAEKGTEHYRMAMQNRQDEATKLKYIMTTEDLIPEGVVCGFRRLLQGTTGPEMAMMKNMEEKGRLMKEQIDNEMELRKQALVEQLEAAGIDPAPYMKKFESAGEIDDPDLQRLMDFLDSIVPGASKGNKNVDFKDIDISKMSELQKEMEIFADVQKQKIKDRLMSQAESLAGQEETAQAAEEIRKAVAQMDEPPPLPRPELDEVIVQMKRALAEARSQYEQLTQMGVDPEQLKALNIDIDIDDLERQFIEARAKLKGVYRMGAHELQKGDPPHVDRMDEKKQEFLDRLAAGKSFHDGDYAALDFTGIELSGTDLSLAYLEDADFTNARLDSVNFADAILARAGFSGAEVVNADFGGANVGASMAPGARFTRCSFTGATLSKARLQGAAFIECDFTDAYFLEAELEGVEFRGCKLQKAVFLDRVFGKSVFTGSDLTNATFLNCRLEGSDFSNTTLFETIFVNAGAARCNFSDADMTNARFVMGSDLAGCRFRGACLDKANLRDTELQQADFTDASINMTDFSEARMEKVVFNRARGERPLFMKSDLALADLSNAGFYEGSMLKARLTSATLKGSNLYAVEFLGATVGATDFSGAILDKSKLRDWRPES